MISIRQARKTFTAKSGFGKKAVVTQALDGIDLEILEGETLGLVGESGSGKTTLGRAVIGLETLTSGTISYKGKPLDKEAQKEMQVIFQDPYFSLSPSRSALDSVMEPLLLQMDRKAARQRAEEILHRVGIDGDDITKLPRAFSGGQRQRIGIARAVATRPKFILCDEPTSALDVSIQAQILTLLRELQETIGLTYLFISHDLSVVRHVSDRIAIMYHGRIVELGTSEQIFTNPKHPYTKRLLMAAPESDPVRARRQMEKQSATLEDVILTDSFDWQEQEPGHFVRVNKALPD